MAVAADGGCSTGNKAGVTVMMMAVGMVKVAKGVERAQRGVTPSPRMWRGGGAGGRGREQSRPLHESRPRRMGLLSSRLSALTHLAPSPPPKK